ncbi:MAG: glycosyltransferase [Candidatus Woesearchaeota archaeon]|nr:glycosyltransferase [Candidatus Woesearchaeota archaeon]
MRVLIITPKYYPTISGNTESVARISQGLQALGVQTTVITPAQYTKELEENADLVHIFHATKGYVPTRKPYIVSLTGTDMNVHAFQEDKHELLKESINNSQHITTYEPRDFTQLTDIGCILPPHTTIPKSVTLPESTFDVRTHFNIPKEHTLFLLIAAIREVKDPLYAVTELEQLENKTLLILGEVHDETLHQQIKRPWVIVGKLPHEHMYAAYEAADIVLNTSDSESCANAVIEAMFMEKQLFVADVPGNQHVPKNRRFEKVQGALAKILETLPPINYGGKFPTQEAEARAYKKVYEHVMRSLSHSAAT